MPLVSICIPAYNNPYYLIRAIDSIIIQSFRDFEVIITDDSPSDILKSVILDKYNHLDYIHYYKNERQLGSTANWNRAITLSSSPLIKILHHDDWFSDETSLQRFVNPFLENSSIDFAFCQSTHFSKEKYLETYIPPKHLLKRLRHDPSILFVENFIITPSSTIYKKTKLEFDSNLTWLVDADFYSTYLQSGSLYYIPQPLICINLSEDRLTNICETDLKLLVAEHIYLLNKYKESPATTQNILRYFRKIVRNFKIYNVSKIKVKTGIKEIPKEMELTINNIGILGQFNDSIYRCLRSIKRKFWGRKKVFI